MSLNNIVLYKKNHLLGVLFSLVLVFFLLCTPRLLADRATASALIFASSEGQVSTVKALLEGKKVDVNESIEGGVTALIAAAQNGHDDVVEMLLKEKGINVNAKMKVAGNITALPINMSSLRNMHVYTFVIF